MQEVEIRPTTVNDAVALQAAVDQVAREARWLGAANAQSVEATEGFISARIDAAEPHFVAVAEKVIGWCDIARYPAESRRHCGRLGMGLLPEWRGRGLGGRLLRAVLDGADRLGLARVELDVVADNVAAIALYERVGFAQEGLRPGGWSLNGLTRDLILMGRARPVSAED